MSTGPDIARRDDVAAAYSAAAAAANDATLSVRPGSTSTVAGPVVAPVTDDELVARVDALGDTAAAVLVGLATLRDSDAAGRTGAAVALEAAAHHAWLVTRELQIARRELLERLADDGSAGEEQVPQPVRQGVE